MPSSRRVSHPRSSSHLILHRGILYFRILVPNHLQSLIGKREIRRSSNGLDNRTARTKALRLSLVAQHFFALSEDLVEERIHSVQDKISQQFGITKENIKSVGTFLFDATLEKDLSPASLTLLLPSFLRGQKGTLSIKMFSEKAVPTRKASLRDGGLAVRQEDNLPIRSVCGAFRTFRNGCFFHRTRPHETFHRYPCPDRGGLFPPRLRTHAAH